MNKRRLFVIDWLLLLIITIPTFTSLLNNQYFTIHDNQHVVRLYLLDQGIRQGYLYPRWVDWLSFGFGDPLFNFYPPLVYYLGEIFHLLGFSLIWSVKLVFILGFLLAAASMFLLAKEYLGRLAAFLSATVYSYFFYHAINAYVRGALSEFFAMSLVPLVFLFFHRLSKKTNLKNSIMLAVALDLVFLAHQLVALPMIFFLLFYFIYYFLSVKKDQFRFFKFLALGSLLSLGLSAFYWLPMFVERSYTFIDQELGSYKLHYINPYQFWYSPWGFGGSVAGLGDGMTFQLGKIPILLFGISLAGFFIYLFKTKNKKETTNFIFFNFLLFFSLFMTTNYSSFFWDRIKLLWNLQFPWRFSVFTGIFISLVGAYWLFFIDKIFKNKLSFFIPTALVTFVICVTIFKYQQYFRPQTLISVSDKDLTTTDEITWKQSKTVLHFVPKGIKAKKTKSGVYILDIEKKDLPKQIYQLNKGNAKVEILENKFMNKTFKVDVKSLAEFQLNTFHFLGWQAYLDHKKIRINDKNKYKLITVLLPKGKHELKFVFEDTLSRLIGNILSLFSVLILIVLKRK